MKKALILVLILALGYLQYRLWVGHNSLSEVRELEARLDRLQAEVEAQRQANEQLQAEVEALRNPEESGAMEEQIRERLGRVRDNETLYLFVDPEDE